MTKGNLITSATIEGQIGVVWHLEFMELHKDYKILINGKRYLVRKSDADHIWFRDDLT